jgi:pyridoxine 5-phosphate synthase
VKPGEVTSQAGWQPGPATDRLKDVIDDFRSRGVRVSLFVDPVPAAIRWAASMGADRVELYTEPFARAFESAGPEGSATRAVFKQYADASTLAHSLGLGVNAGHDLDLENLVLFRALPYLDEVSIGHAIVSRALYVGLATVIREYRDVLAGPGGTVS